MWPHIINNSKFLTRWGQILKVTWISNEWSLMLDLFSLHVIFFFFFCGYAGWIFCYLFEIFFFCTKIFTSAWLLGILTFYLHFLLRRLFPTFFPCCLLPILETLCIYSHFVKHFFLIYPFGLQILLRKVSPFLVGKAFLPFLTETEPSSILKFQRSPAEVPGLKILRLVTLNYWSFWAAKISILFLRVSLLYFSFLSFLWNKEHMELFPHLSALTHVFLFLQGVKTHFFPRKSATSILIFFLVLTLF